MLLAGWAFSAALLPGGPRPGFALHATLRRRAHASANWNLAKQEAHDQLISLVRETLLAADARDVPAAGLHTEAAVRDLPAEYNLRFGATEAALTPDLVAADYASWEVLIIEVTIVPCAALPKYAARKRRKYAGLSSRGESAAQSGFRVLAPLVVAVGTGGTVPACTLEAMRTIGLTEDEARAFSARAVAVATSRPDAGWRTRTRRRSDGREPAASQAQRLRGSRAERKAAKCRRQAEGGGSAHANSTR